MIKEKRSRKIMEIFLFVLLIIVVLVVIFFKLPYSKTVSEFSNVINQHIVNTKGESGFFEEKDIEDMPLPVQRYFRFCGYIGTPKMFYMKATFEDVDFKMSKDKTIKIDYTQYNFVEKPERFALINSSLYGIPFEGFDSYDNGVGSMKGSIAKVVTLFDQRGDEMDKACLVTILAECLAVPNIALQDYIKWEAIDDTHAKATINYYGISASGIFTFNEEGAMLSFRTKDRVATDMNGFTREAEWSTIICEYKEINGLKYPDKLQSIWHYEEGDSIYFNENKASISIEYY